MRPADQTITELRTANERLENEIAALKKAQEELRASEQELSDFFENAAIPMYWVGADGTILRANQAELKALGYSRDEYVGHHLSEFHVDRSVIEDILARLGKGETLRDYEARLRAKDGSIKHVTINANVMWNNGDFIHARCFTRDITKRKHVEHRIAAERAVTRILAESRTLAEAASKLLQAIGASLEWQFGAFWTVDEHAKALQCVAIWQEPSTEFPEFAAVCRRWLFEPAIGLPGSIWKNRKPAWIPDVLKDSNFPRAPMAAKDNLHGAFGFPVQLGGEVFGVMEFFSREIREPDESLLQMVDAIGSEVGQFLERLQAQSELQQKNERLQNAIAEQTFYQETLRSHNEVLLEARAAVENERKRYQDLFEFAPDGYLVTDIYGKILEANRAATSQLNTALNMLTSQPLSFFIQPDQTDSFYSALRQMKFEKASVRREFRLRPPHLSPFDAELTAMTVCDAGGGAIGFRWLIRDVTEQKQAQQALLQGEEKLRRQAQELERQLIASGRLVSIGELTASMAHEFNNPLGIIIGFAQDLMSETDSSHPSYPALKIIEEETKRCEKIIQELLQFARPSASEPQPIDVGECVEKTLTLVSNHLSKHKIEAATKIPQSLPRIRADARQLEQVLVNLYLNAIDAMPEGGKLTTAVRLEPSEENSSMIAITVADTGFGIDGEDLSRIFQPFFSVKKKRGLGLGLPVCERIIRNHGGTIDVESRPGKGTTFSVFLPVEQKTAA
jgi:PAS domain S-box-containing protein